MARDRNETLGAIGDSGLIEPMYGRGVSANGLDGLGMMVTDSPVDIISRPTSCSNPMTTVRRLPEPEDRLLANKDMVVHPGC
jgi:hypothetical protein